MASFDASRSAGSEAVVSIVIHHRFGALDVPEAG